MARYTDANCKLCRREGAKLFLKGERCFSDKCAIQKRAYSPGQHGQRHGRKLSEYGVRLREKQKVKRTYGILEKQFKNYFQKASRQKGESGENLLILLERRLDNIVYRVGFAPSRKAARQLVRHRHILVNEKLLDIPSYLVCVEDTIKVQQKSRQMEMIHASLSRMVTEQELSWFSVDKANLTGTLLAIPTREDIPTPAEEQLIVEFYSR